MIMMDRQKLKNAAGVGGGGPIIGGPLTSNLVMPFESQSPYIPQSLYAQALQRPNTSMNTHSSRFYQSSRKNSQNTIMSRRGSNNPRSDLKLLLQQDPNLVILNDSKLQAQQHLYRPLRQSYLEAQGQSLAIKKFIVNSSTKRANTSLNHSKTRLQTESSAQNGLKQIQNSPSPFRQKNSQAIVAQNNSNTYFQPNTANLNQQNQFTSYGSRANSPAPMQRSKYYNYLNQKSNGNNTSNNNNYTQKSIGISQEMEVNLQNSNNNSGYPSRYYNNIISTGVSPERIVNHVQQLYSRPRSSSNTKHSLYPHRTQASSPNNNDLRSVPLGHYHHQQVFKTENDQNPINNSSGNTFTNQTQASNVIPPQNEVKVLREIDQIIKKIQKKNTVPLNQNTETLQSLNDAGEMNEANTDKYQEDDENSAKKNQQTTTQDENQNNPELDNNEPKSAIENQIPVVQLKSYQSSNPQQTQPPRSHTPESLSNSNGQTVNSRQNQRGLKDISNKIQQANYKIRNNNFFNNNQMTEGDLELSTNFQKQQIYRNNNIILQQLPNSQNYQQIPTSSNQKVLSEETQYLHKQYLFYQQQQQILKQQQIQQNMLAQHNNIVQQPQFYSKRNSNSSIQEKQLQLQIQQQQLQQQQYQISLQQQSSFLGLSSGSVTLDTFEMGAKIGTGSYAVVNLAIDKRTNQKVAIKVYEKEKLQDPHKMKNVKREVQILSHISHFNIIKLYYVIDAPTTVNDLFLNYFFKQVFISINNFIKNISQIQQWNILALHHFTAIQKLNQTGDYQKTMLVKYLGKLQKELNICIVEILSTEIQNQKIFQQMTIKMLKLLILGLQFVLLKIKSQLHFVVPHPIWLLKQFLKKIIMVLLQTYGLVVYCFLYFFVEHFHLEEMTKKICIKKYKNVNQKFLPMFHQVQSCQYKEYQNLFRKNVLMQKKYLKIHGFSMEEVHLHHLTQKKLYLLPIPQRIDFNQILIFYINKLTILNKTNYNNNKISKQNKHSQN
ncbi:hypothetical protein ABPG74_005309 [Tetrahymena malaccensis]